MQRDAFGTANRALVTDPSGLSDELVLSVRYPAGTVNPGRSPQGGTGVYTAPMDISNANNVTIQFDIFFSEGFDFVKGGKLPGIYAGRQSCTGGSRTNDCFSMRHMWRVRGEGEAYLYVPRDIQVPEFCRFPPQTVCNNAFGVSFSRGSFQFIPGQWSKLRTTIGLNTFDNNGRPNPDGVLAIWYAANDTDDYKEAVQFGRLIWRQAPSVRFIGIHLESFFGGSDSSWATPSTVFTYYRNFSLAAF
ncbi:hypothetical protein HK102_007839 [Quaeritorhiza haematococci]|nr:hypothetical protein HK102_007839 [Quaeritorhiza haematococci]